MRVWYSVALIASLTACGEGRTSAPKAQVEPDTVTFRMELREAMRLARSGDDPGAEAIAREVLAQSRDPRLSKQRIGAISILGQIVQRRAELDTALALYREGLEVALTARDTGGIGTMWINIGTALEDKGEYAEALHAQLQALHWKELARDPRSTARALHNLSILYWRQDSMDQALRTLEKSIALKRVHDPRGLALGLNGKGLLLMELGDLDNARVVLKESLAMEDSLNAGRGRQVQLSNLGLVFERTGALDSAAVYYAASLDEARLQEDPFAIVRSLFGAGDVLREQGRHAEALPLLDSSLARAVRLNSREDIKDAHMSLSRLHEAMGHAQLALDHYRGYHALSDSLMNDGTQAAMEELRLQYDTEKKDRENKELRAAQELTALRAERNRWIAIGTGVLAVAGAVLAWSIVQRNRQRARQREAELEQQALRLQMDPHFLFNALNTVPGLYASGDPVAANDHVADLSRYLRLVLETSRRRTIPLDQEVELVERYLRISANRKPGSFTWSMRVMPYVQAERIAIPPMLIQPIVENAIEHGFNGTAKGHVSVLVDRAGSVLHIEVKDNGQGRGAAALRPSRRNGTSMGLDLVHKRIALFDKHTPLTEAVVVHDDKEQDEVRGTTVVLRLRVYELNEHAAIGDR